MSADELKAEGLRDELSEYRYAELYRRGWRGPDEVARITAERDAAVTEAQRILLEELVFSFLGAATNPEIRAAMAEQYTANGHAGLEPWSYGSKTDWFDQVRRILVTRGDTP